MKQIKQQLSLIVVLLLCSIGIANAEVKSGSCGTNVTYTLDIATGELKIKGTGEMTNWDYSSYAPWYYNRYYIKSASISDGVTSIGSHAFHGCSALTSVTIGNSVTSIGYDAFYGCSGLTSVVWNAKKCNDLSFNYDTFPTTVENITFGDEVEYIPAFLCKRMTGLTSVTIGNSVTTIGDDAFNGCSGLTSVTIPNSVTSIGYEAFRGCYGLTSVTIGNNVTSIGNYAFSGCSGLTSVTIGNSVASIGRSAFDGCSGLASVTIPNSVTTIGDDAFYCCSGLTSVTIPNSVTSIGRSAFYKCSGLTSVTIPNSVTSIGEEAFSDCSGLTSVTIPNSVTSIEGYAFSGCSGLTSIKVDEGNKVFDSRNDCNAIINSSTNELVVGCNNTTIPESVTSIGNYAFNGCSGLTSVTIPNGVTSIGSSAFYGCSGLTSVTLPESVTSIGSSAFRGCSGLTKAEFASIESLCKISFGSGANPLSYAKHLYVDGKEVTDLVIPNSVTSIGGYAFDGCSGLASVTIPESVTSIGNYAFSGCSDVKNIINLSSAPQISTGSLPTTATVHVLKGCKSAYSTSSAWSGYNIVEDAETFFPLESVSFEKEKMYVKIGSVFKLTPMIEPSDVPASIYDLIWMTSDPSVLYLDQNTQRFMAMKEGTATVTVTAIDANENIKSAQVTVYVGDGIDPEDNGAPQCEAPIIKYTNGNIICVSATDNAVCHYTCKIIGESEGEDSGSSAGIPLKIEITAYATADGFSKSKNTVKTFDYKASGSGIKGDVNGDGKVNVNDVNAVIDVICSK